MRFTVYGVSDWPEFDGEFLIFSNKEFSTADEAEKAARVHYGDKIELVIKEEQSR